MANGYTQKELSQIMGVALSTVGNMESYPHRVIRRDRLERALIRLGADASRTERILAAYDGAPISEFAKKRREHFAKMRAQRKAAKSAPELARALVRLLSLRLLEGDRCDCGEVDGALFRCELCEGLEALRIDVSLADDSDGAIAAVDQLASELGAGNEAPPSTGNPQAVNGDDLEDEFG